MWNLFRNTALSLTLLLPAQSFGFDPQAAAASGKSSGNSQQTAKPPKHDKVPDYNIPAVNLLVTGYIDSSETTQTPYLLVTDIHVNGNKKESGRATYAINPWKGTITVAQELHGKKTIMVGTFAVRCLQGQTDANGNPIIEANVQWLVVDGKKVEQSALKGQGKLIELALDENLGAQAVARLFSNYALQGEPRNSAAINPETGEPVAQIGRQVFAFETLVSKNQYLCYYSRPLARYRVPIYRLIAGTADKTSLTPENNGQAHIFRDGAAKPIVDFAGPVYGEQLPAFIAGPKLNDTSFQFGVLPEDPAQRQRAYQDSQRAIDMTKPLEFGSVGHRVKDWFNTSGCYFSTPPIITIHP